MSNNCNYDYLDAVTYDVIDAIKNNADYNDDYRYIYNSTSDGREVLAERLQDDLWTDDTVTGNASGSYTFSTYIAEENLCHNYDLLEQACDEFGQDFGDAVRAGAESCDVTIRCYLLPQAIEEALNQLEQNGWFDEYDASDDTDEND